MKTLFLVCFLLASSNLVHASHESLKETCKAVTKSKSFYEFCMTSLQVVPGCQTYNVYNLTVIVAKLTRTNFTSAYTKYLELSKQNGWTNATLLSFGVCLEIYSDTRAVDYVVSQAKTKAYSGMELDLSAVLADVDTCVEAFEEGGEKSPIPKVDNDVYHLAVLALNFANLCQNN